MTGACKAIIVPGMTGPNGSSRLPSAIQEVTSVLASLFVDSQTVGSPSRVSFSASDRSP